VPGKTRTTKTTTRRYRADRAFNELNAGDVVEMKDDHPYLQTGYMQPVEDDAAASADTSQEVAGMSTTTVSESGASGENEGPAGAGAGTGTGSSS
jgi:hypothetical protein